MFKIFKKKKVSSLYYDPRENYKYENSYIDVFRLY
ncbi:MAG: hypothetical protein PWP28_1503 [Oceanotoga sp.]|jgi:hypothetical protein|uniref:Uncharacterized protein n=1 Tax=Oceanotoga teriensis TaxID=515440 RepID=A0AA45HIT5_9BACT|nr:hypothetical protein [Oceanotoga sp.]PWJ95064.1 hypothetical protein C7380_10719 [Oceanotoga teriensis]